MKKQFDTLVFIGRFQPFHNGHKAVIDKALQHAEQVVVVVGSSFAARSTKNPFTFEERKAMIDAVYPKESGKAKFHERNPRIKIVPVADYPYDDNAWVSAVQSSVDNIKTGTKTGLIGHSKDSSSYYLKIFPQWRNHVEVENVDGINATDIRHMLFSTDGTPVDIMSATPIKTYNWMSKFILDNAHTLGLWARLCIEYEQIAEYREKSQMKGFNFPSVFVTTDAVLTQSGYILLIKRGGFPYKDCWALPGGYLDKGKFIVENMIKELREETKLKVPDKVLKGSIKSVEMFDHPDRDPRGRVITHGFYIDLGFPDEKLPKVKGSDDAKHAEWVKLSDVTSDMMAFDHYHIIKRFIPTY